VAGNRLSRNHDDMLHPSVILDHSVDDSDMPRMAMISLTTSWHRMTVLFIIAGDVYFLVSRGWIPNCKARSDMETMAGSDSCCALFDVVVMVDKKFYCGWMAEVVSDKSELR